VIILCLGAAMILSGMTITKRTLWLGVILVILGVVVLFAVPGSEPGH
jgi:hypothetical protein